MRRRHARGVSHLATARPTLKDDARGQSITSPTEPATTKQADQADQANQADQADQGDQKKRDEDAALVPLLLLMTVVTGIVDAVSILRLGHVFVANMTGNVVFLGFAMAGSPGFSISASLVALVAFLAGAAVWGRIPTAGRRPALARTVAVEAALVAVATVVAIAAHGSGQRYAMTILLAVAMGAQNVTVRRLAVADMTTTVLTLTLTGLAADPPDVAKPNSRTTRRLAAVAAMLTGAVAGAIVVLHSSTGWALGGATALLVTVAIVAQFGVHPAKKVARQ